MFMGQNVKELAKRDLKDKLVKLTEIRIQCNKCKVTRRKK
jgi:hypothetical protein